MMKSKKDAILDFVCDVSNIVSENNVPNHSSVKRKDEQHTKAQCKKKIWNKSTIIHTIGLIENILIVNECASNLKYKKGCI